MFLFDFFRSFQPLHNPIGFGSVDFIEFALAALLLLLVVARARLEPAFRRLAAHTAWCMLLLAALPIALRLALLHHHPVPIPAGSDDFSYFLLADTLKHFRLANPTHPFYRFFEAIFVLQQPTYSSIFPPGQGLAMALGWMLFGHPWAGVVLSVGALCALCYWMLRGWTGPGWALLGGLLAVMQFGPLNQWMNSYWGGAVSGCGGCLVFGALPRLRETGRARDAVWLGLGLGLQLLTRPYEFVLLLLAAALFFVPASRAAVKSERPPVRYRRLALSALVAFSPAVGLTLLQNHAVSGSWATLPYLVSRYQYGVPATFTFQPNAVPHRQLTTEQQLGYEAQAEAHGPGVDSPGAWFERFTSRVRFYRFFFAVPLYLALPFFLPRLREFRFAWVAVVLALFSLGTNFYPFFYPHYIAAATCLFLLAGIAGLERLSRVKLRGLPAGRGAARLILYLCAAHFLFWYGLHLLANDEILVGLGRFETWDVINYGDPQGRIAIDGQLARLPGRQLVFVHHWPERTAHEWVHNGADIDAARVVWAGDLGPEENEKLRRYYPDRTAWMVYPDSHPVPRLVPYRPDLPR